MSSIAVIGKSDIVSVFSAFGVSVYPVDNSEDAVSKLNELISHNTDIVFITEEPASQIRDVIFDLNLKIQTSITVIPDHKGSKGLATSIIKDTVKEAVGMDII
ncbi:hypothetical protein KAI19_03720 [bacterium]|nr:hypothetical protein [bacterium]